MIVVDVAFLMSVVLIYNEHYRDKLVELLFRMLNIFSLLMYQITNNLCCSNS